MVDCGRSILVQSYAYIVILAGFGGASLCDPRFRHDGMIFVTVERIGNLPDPEFSDQFGSMERYQRALADVKAKFEVYAEGLADIRAWVFGDEENCSVEKAPGQDSKLCQEPGAQSKSL